MDRKHFKCWLWKILWGLGAVALIGAWVAGPEGTVAGFGAQHLFGDALVLGVLAISIKLDCTGCETCKV